MKPVVSIIIPLFNKEKYIIETLTSVFHQEFQDWECLIVNDGSNDNSLKLIQPFLNDSRFKLFDNLEKGASAARNLGIRNSKGKYLQFLDADDLLSCHKLKLQVQILEDDHSVDLITCKWGSFSNNNKEVFENFPSYKNFFTIPDFLNSLASSRGFFPLHAYLIRKSIIYMNMTAEEI